MTTVTFWASYVTYLIWQSLKGNNRVNFGENEKSEFPVLIKRKKTNTHRKDELDKFYCNSVLSFSISANRSSALMVPYKLNYVYRYLIHPKKNIEENLVLEHRKLLHGKSNHFIKYKFRNNRWRTCNIWVPS